MLFRTYERMCQDLADRTSQNEKIFYDKRRPAVRAYDVHSGPSEILRPFAYSPEYTKSYTAFRMLSSFSVIRRLLQDLKETRPDFKPDSILDFGAGPGTTLWAAEDVWPDTVRKCLNVEPSESMIDAGNHLMGYGPFDEERILVQWCSSITEPSVRTSISLITFHTHSTTLTQRHSLNEYTHNRYKDVSILLLLPLT